MMLAAMRMQRLVIRIAEASRDCGEITEIVAGVWEMLEMGLA